MNSFNEKLDFKNILDSDLPLEAKVNVLFDILKNVLDEGAIRARTVRFKLQKYINSTDINERIYALNVIASDGNGAKIVPNDSEAVEVLEDVVYWISENIAKKYVQNKIEVEVETLEQVKEAVDAGADIIMLDNMSVEDMKKAIEIIDGRAETECSGNVTKENIEKLTALGVDYISSGALTHSAPILDLSLKNLQVK